MDNGSGSFPYGLNLETRILDMTSTTLPSVSDIHRMPWNVPVPGVAGIITRLFAPMARAGWSLQNGRIRDPDTGTEIEFMLSKRDSFLSPSNDVNKWIEVSAHGEGSVVWKAQESRPTVNRGKPFAKLEIEREALVKVLERRPDAPDLFSMQRPAPESRSAEPISPAHPPTPQAPAPVPNNVTPMSASSGASAVVQPTQSMRRLGVLYVLAREQAVEALRLSGVAEPTSADIQSATSLIYVQATRDGLYQQLDPDQIVIARDPAAAESLQPNLHSLRQLAEGRDGTLNLLLIGSGILKPGQRWQDLSEHQASQVLKEDAIMRVLKAS